MEIVRFGTWKNLEVLSPTCGAKFSVTHFDPPPNLFSAFLLKTSPLFTKFMLLLHIMEISEIHFAWFLTRSQPALSS